MGGAGTRLGVRLPETRAAGWIDEMARDPRRTHVQVGVPIRDENRRKSLNCKTIYKLNKQNLKTAKEEQRRKKRLKSFIFIDNFPAINKPADVAMALRLQIQHATNL